MNRFSLNLWYRHPKGSQASFPTLVGEPTDAPPDKPLLSSDASTRQHLACGGICSVRSAEVSLRTLAWRLGSQWTLRTIVSEGQCTALHIIVNSTAPTTLLGRNHVAGRYYRGYMGCKTYWWKTIEYIKPPPVMNPDLRLLAAIAAAC